MDFSYFFEYQPRVNKRMFEKISDFSIMTGTMFYSNNYRTGSIIPSPSRRTMSCSKFIADSSFPKYTNHHIVTGGNRGYLKKKRSPPLPKMN